MSFVSKKQKEVNTFLAQNNISSNAFSVEQALDLFAKYNSSTAFKSKKNVDWSVDINFHVNVEPGKSVNSSIVLAHGNGKKHKLIAFVGDENVALAKKLGATEAGLDALIEKVLGGFSDFDKCVATQDVFATVSKKLARVLGPKGLLPSVKAGTVSNDLESLIKNVLGGQVSIKASKTGTVAASIARVSFEKNKIIENARAFTASLKALKGSGNKVFINNVYLSTTMGFGVKINDL